VIIMKDNKRSIDRVSVAEGKKGLSRLLKKAAEEDSAVLIYNERRGELAGALLSPAEYERYGRLRAYFEALRLSRKFSAVDLDLAELGRASRQELEDRAT